VEFESHSKPYSLRDRTPTKAPATSQRNPYPNDPSTNAEEAMTQPSKYFVREWLYKQLKSKEPPPSPEEIKRQLGNWHFEQKKS
jgi:hypothetical protein